MRLLALTLGDGRLRFSIRPGEGSEDALTRYSALVHDDRANGRRRRRPSGCVSYVRWCREIDLPPLC